MLGTPTRASTSPWAKKVPSFSVCGILRKGVEAGAGDAVAGAGLRDARTERFCSGFLVGSRLVFVSRFAGDSIGPLEDSRDGVVRSLWSISKATALAAS